MPRSPPDSPMRTKATLKRAVREGHARVSGQGQRQPRSRRRSVDRVHDWLRHFVHGPNQPGRPGLPGQPVLHTTEVGCGRVCPQLREVLSGAEPSAGAGDDHNPNGPVARHLVDRLFELVVHLEGDRVQAVRPVHGEQHDLRRRSSSQRQRLHSGVLDSRMGPIIVLNALNADHVHGPGSLGPWYRQLGTYAGSMPAALQAPAQPTPARTPRPRSTPPQQRSGPGYDPAPRRSSRSDASMPNRSTPRLARFRPLQQLLWDDGWNRLGWPPDCGGLGGSPLHRFVVMEELAAAGFVNPELLGSVEIIAPMLCGTPPSLRRSFAAGLRGDEVWCQGFSEPDAGSDLGSLRTRAVPDGRASGSPARRCGAATATSPRGAACWPHRGSAGYRGLTMFWVDMHARCRWCRRVRERPRRDGRDLLRRRLRAGDHVVGASARVGKW